MAQPVWITPAGNLGTVPEGVFYQNILDATDPSSGNVYYQVIAGDLPQGIEVTKAGIIQGVPSANVTVGSEQIQTGRDTISKFAVRAYTTTIIAGKPVVSRIADRTFSLTVASQNYPQWITPPGQIAQLLDGTLLSPGLQLDYITDNKSSQPDISLVSGQLPPGLTISSTGLISGVVIPNPGPNALTGYSSANVSGLEIDAVDIIPGVDYIIATPGTTNWEAIGADNDNARTEFTANSVTPTGNGTAYVASTVVYTDEQGYEEYAFDFPQVSISYNYQFTLQVTDGQTSALRTFSIFVLSTNLFNASAETLTPNPDYPPTPPEFFTDPMSADNSILTADISSIPSPLVLNPQGSIGSYRNDNFFAYQFIGEIVNNDQLNFSIVNPPPGLTLDPGTGWLYGYIPNLGLTELTYDFTIYAYSITTPGLISAPYEYSITFVGPISTDITWLTPSNLGVIANGSTSKLYVRAVAASGLPLQYQLASGSNSELPQGLRLLPSGNIVGRVSFDTFSLDMGTTTFDNNTTTFDSTYTFTVNAFSINGLISVFKTFTIRVLRVFNEPYNNLYIQCMPPRDDRLLISNLLQNKQIFPPELLYRYDDPNFGLASVVQYRHAYGLTAATLDDYVQSLELNHYWKNLVLGEIKTARALDPVTGEVIYEVVYSQIIDDLVNPEGESVSKLVPLAYPINPNTVDQISVVYPNALVDMREQVIDVVGQVSNILPEWMLTKQADGTVLGFVPAWVIAYTIPGASGQIAYNITSQFGTNLNLVDFKADRYELDRALTYTWDPDVTTLTITNIVANGVASTASYATQPAPPFAPGDMIKIEGVTPTYFNGTFYVTTCGNASVSFLSNVVGTYGSGGTVSSTPHWAPYPANETTFDVEPHYSTAVQHYVAGGTNYQVGDVIKILGTNVGGTTPENDVTIVVNTVTSSGAIDVDVLSVTAGNFVVNLTYTIQSLGTTDFTLIGAASNTVGVSFTATGPGVGTGTAYLTNTSALVFVSGQASLLALGNTYTNVPGTNVIGTGTGATWDITVVATVQAGNFVVGKTYTIQSLGTTDFALIGADATAVTVQAGRFDIGTIYTIESVGTTDFTLIGAATNTVGTIFSATGAGTGTGTASFNTILVGTVFTATGSGVGTGLATPINPPGTIFDGGSMEFVTPANTDTSSQAFDRYLLYPKRNILE